MGSNNLVVTWVQTILEARYPIIAINWLTFYEWMLTASMEVELIHKADWTSAKLAYLLCRYYPMIYWPVVAWAYVGNHDPALCPRIVVPVQLFQAPLQIFPQAVMVMRAYAFTGRNKKILACLLMGYMSLIAVNLWVFSSQNTLPGVFFYQMIGPTGCFPNYGIKTLAMRIGYLMLAAILMDGFCLGVILVHYYRTSGAEITLGRFFVFQGMHAFLFMLVVNTVTAVLFFLPRQPHTGIGLPLFLVLPNLIACRLVLHLRSQVAPTDSEISRRNSEIVDDAFATLSEPSLSRHSSTHDAWLLEESQKIEIPVYRGP